MDDGPIVISSGNLYSPESVATKTFATGFRGYDQSEVRSYLQRVASELTEAATREAELREALLEAHKQAAHPNVDEDTLTAALGEHAAHLLTKAREAAANIVAESDKRAARIIGEAEVRIARVRSEADGLLARRSEEADRMTSGVRQAAEAAARTLRDRARAESEAEVESARKQGREMVGEARAVRERMLADLTRRRRTAEVQIEHLRMARVRLLEAYAVVRRTLDEATHELGTAEAEAGPVLDAAAGRIPRDRDRDPDRGTDEARRSPSSGRGSASGSTRPGDPPQQRPAVSAPSAQELAGALHPRIGASPPPSIEADRAPEVEASKEAEAPKAEAPKAEAPNVDAPKVDAPKVDALRIGAPTVGAPPTDAEPTDAERSEPAAPTTRAVGETGPPATTSAEDLFARLRAAQTPTPPTDAPPPAPASKPAPPAEATRSSHGGNASTTAPPTANDEASPPVREESALAWRDQMLEPIEADLVRRLKRVLQDEQNEVLDRLRRERRPTPDSVLPSLDEQVGRYQAAAVALLAQAADRGSEFVVSPGGGTDADAVPRGGWNAEQWAADLAVDLVVPLRDRLEAAISAAVVEGSGSDRDPYDVSGVSEGLGASYRQWKATQIAVTARHYASVAFAEGAFTATASGAERCWVVDDDGGPCPDCDDNTLAGAVTKGEPFPTGQTHPPAHDGCRCVLVAPPT